MSPVAITLALLLFVIVMFVWEKIPLAVTSIIALLVLVLTGVLSPKDAFGGFVDNNLILFVAMFVIGGCFFETGMANRVGGIVTKFAHTERELIVAVMLVTGIMSGFLSNTGTAAILIPIVIGTASKSGFSRSRLLLPLIFAAAMGGVDVITFTAGVGENGIEDRAAIAEGLEYLGAKLDPQRNDVRGKDALISTDDSTVKMYVIPTNEEIMIARDTKDIVSKQ